MTNEEQTYSVVTSVETSEYGIIRPAAVTGLTGDKAQEIRLAQRGIYGSRYPGAVVDVRIV